MYPVHLIPSLVDEPSVILLEDIVLHFWSLDNYGKTGSSPSLFLWDRLEVTKTVSCVCFKVIPGVNLINFHNKVNTSV